MERLCYTFDLTPGMEEEYERRHAEAWPELLQALRNRGSRTTRSFGVASR